MLKQALFFFWQWPLLVMGESLLDTVSENSGETLALRVFLM